MAGVAITGEISILKFLFINFQCCVHILHMFGKLARLREESAFVKGDLRSVRFEIAGLPGKLNQI